MVYLAIIIHPFNCSLLLFSHPNPGDSNLSFILCICNLLYCAEISSSHHSPVVPQSSFVDNEVNILLSPSKQTVVTDSENSDIQFNSSQIECEGVMNATKLNVSKEDARDEDYRCVNVGSINSYSHTCK